MESEKLNQQLCESILKHSTHILCRTLQVYNNSFCMLLSSQVPPYGFILCVIASGQSERFLYVIQFTIGVNLEWLAAACRILLLPGDNLTQRQKKKSTTCFSQPTSLIACATRWQSPTQAEGLYVIPLHSCDTSLQPPLHNLCSAGLLSTVWHRNTSGCTWESSQDEFSTC